MNQPTPPHDEAATVGPRCGNNPNARLADGDRQAVAEFKAYLADRAAAMTTGPTSLWAALVQWQPATAAALADHLRSLPADWLPRELQVVRLDAALTLPPGAQGEQFPDRAPEIAPYDEIATRDGCPACEEVGGNCRFHEGYAAGHHEAAQAQRDVVKDRPGISLREFMLWQSDVAEAADRGEQPPDLPAAPDDTARRVLTPGEYDAAWHAVEGAAGESGADPATVLGAVLDRLGIQPPPTA